MDKVILQRRSIHHVKVLNDLKSQWFLQPPPSLAAMALSLSARRNLRPWETSTSSTPSVAHPTPRELGQDPYRPPTDISERLTAAPWPSREALTCSPIRWIPTPATRAPLRSPSP